jgi:hypothetical protein
MDAGSSVWTRNRFGRPSSTTKTVRANSSAGYNRLGYGVEHLQRFSVYTAEEPFLNPES